MNNLPKIFATEILKNNPNRFSDNIEIDPALNLAFSQDNGFFTKKIKSSLPYVSPNELINGVQDPEISYIVNNHGHRCDNFSNTHYGKHILFSGCSNTTGMAMPFEKNWARILYNKINSIEENSGFYRLSFCSGGYQKIILNIFKYCKQFGNPDIIFLLLPNTSRELKFLGYNEVDAEDLKLINIMHCVEIGYPYPWEEKEIDDKKNYTFTYLEHHKQMFMNSFIMVKMLEQYCYSNKISLYMGSWDKYQKFLLENIESLDRFYKIFNKDYEKYTYENKNRKEEYLFFARDGQHLGILDSEFIANRFFEEYLNEKN